MNPTKRNAAIFGACGATTAASMAVLHPTSNYVSLGLGFLTGLAITLAVGFTIKSRSNS